MLAKTTNIGHPNVVHEMEGFANQDFHWRPPVLPPDVQHKSLTGGSPSNILILEYDIFSNTNIKGNIQSTPSLSPPSKNKKTISK